MIVREDFKMKSFGRKIVWLVCLLFTSSIIFAQAPKFTASINTLSVAENSMVNLVYKLENGEGSSFNPPDFSPFKASGRPSTQNSMSIVNGAMTKSMSYTYRLLAPKTGNFTIKPATIVVGGKTIKSNPVKIKVVKQSEKNASEEDDFFVDIVVSHEDAYVGQQIYVDYVIFTTKDVRSFNPIDESDYDGFYSINSTHRESTKRVTRDGKEYFSKSMIRRILYPQQTGTYTIGPTNIELGVLTDNQQSGGFFFRARTRPVNVLSNKVDIRVRNLPASNNPAFANAIGKYSMRANIDSRKVTTDDAITINMEVNGDGDPKLVTPPNFINEDEFDIYDPNITVDEWARDKRTHRKVFEYLVVPKKPGNYVIAPEFEYFNVDSSRYMTLKANPTRIVVTQGVGNKDAALLEEKNVVVLNPIKTSTSFSEGTGSFHRSIPYWFLLGLGLLSMVVTGGIHQRQVKSGALDPELIRREKAQKVAMEKLNKAAEYKSKGESSKFYEEIIRAEKEYLADKFSIPATYLKKTSIEESLRDKGVAESTIIDLVALFNTCEMNLYAGGQSESNMQESFTAAEQIITKLEQ